MKKNLPVYGIPYRKIKHDFKMKISFLAFLFLTITLQANSTYSQRTKVSLSLEDVTVSEVIDHIEATTEFKFLFNTKDVDLKRKITINVEKSSIKDVLNFLFSPQGIDFKIIDRKILLRRKVESDALKDSNKIQGKTVTGKIYDESGTPMLGVNVIEQGTSNGVVTDFDGDFSIDVAGPNSVLIISFVGYVTQQIEVGDKEEFEIQLQLDSALDEVVLVGYGSQKKKEITSSVVSIKAEDFNKGNVSDPTQLLQGKVAGLQIGRAGGNPNQPFVIRLRGVNSLSGDASPLVVIDGIIGGSLSSLDPNDIKSIEVLKDASAAAIYGARASAGVLLVTTKSGDEVEGKPRLTLTSQLSFDQISDSPEVASAEQYLALGGQDLGSETDWLDEVSRTGVSQVYNLSYGGNSKNGLRYYASLNYRDNEGIIDNSAEFEQVNGRINLSQKFFDDKLTLNGIIALTSREEDQGFQHSLSQALFFNPTAPVYNEDGSFYETQDQDRYNPVAINNQNVRDRRFKQQVYTLGADYDIIKDLTVSGIYTEQRTSELIGEYSERDALWGGSLVNGWARRATSDVVYRQFDGTITYSGNLNKLDYRATIGQSWNYENVQSFVASNTDFITDEFSYNNLAAGQGINRNGVVPQEGNVAQPQNYVGSNQQESISNAYFIRTSFNYDNALFASATYRREGSSRFGVNNRWGNFWALSGGADLASLMDIPFDQLKLRAGYGVTGTLPSTYTGYISTLRLTSGGYANGEFIPAITPATGSNPDLKWEEKAELNIGADFALFNSRLSGSFDYFERNTTDLLNVVSVPSPPNAVPTQLKNVGELETKGIELQLSYDVIKKKDFNWTVDANISTAKTKLVEFNPDSEQTIIRSRGLEGAVAIGNVRPVWTEEGKEIGQIYAQPFVRYAENGDPIILLKDGSEAVFDPGVFLDEAVNVGDALPDAFLGLNNSFTYKNFDANIFLRAVLGHNLINETRAAYENVSGIAIRNIVVTEGEFNENITVPHYSTRYVEDASFVRLDNMTVGYTLPNFENSPIENIRIYFSGQNLFTITGYKGANPEVRYFDPASASEGRRGNSFTGDRLFPGIDRYTTFLPTKTFSLGLNVNF